MRYRKMGKTGLKLSELSFGAWVTFGSQVGEDVSLACMTAAYDAGVNFFDNAEAYAGGKAEIVMGNVLKKTGWKRESLVLSTKVFWGGEGPNDKGLSHKHIIEGVNNALKRLQVEYVDLCFCHRPDPDTPIEETVRAMDVLVRQGKVFYWGTSEWSAADIMRAHALAKENGLTPPVVEQPQYNMLWRRKVELELLPVFRELGYGTTIWSPLASGLLTGKYSDAPKSSGRLDLPSYKWLREMVVTPERIATVDKLKPLASDLGATLAQLAIAWCLKNANVSTVITGASKPEQVKENMKAAEVAKKLTPDVMERIEGVLRNRPDDQRGDG
jgi:voltage-dependent potassium channel beta subunit